MNEQDLKSIQKSLEALTTITDSLWRRSLENKAWIVAFYGPLVTLLAKQTGKTENQIKADLKRGERAALQKLLEKIEKANPALAGQLDNRDIEDVL